MKTLSKIAVALILLAAVFVGVVKYRNQNRLTVSSVSMLPTLNVGEIVTVNYGAYAAQGPQAGDVVIFRSTSDTKTPPLIGRVLAIPGDEIQFSDDEVVVNGKKIQGPARSPTLPQTVGEFTPTSEKNETRGSRTYPIWIMKASAEGPSANFNIPANAYAYFIAGDFRGASTSSAHFGLIPRDQIMGRVTSASEGDDSL